LPPVVIYINALHFSVQVVFLVVLHFACGTWKTLLVSEWEQYRVFVNMGKTCSDSGVWFSKYSSYFGSFPSCVIWI